MAKKHRHKWSPESSGNKENPGCFSYGSTMIFRYCCPCGRLRIERHDITGNEPQTIRYEWIDNAEA